MQVKVNGREFLVQGPRATSSVGRTHCFKRATWMKKSSDIIPVCFHAGWRSSGRHVLSTVWTASASMHSGCWLSFCEPSQMVVFLFDLMLSWGGINVEFWLDVEFLAQKPPRWNRQKRTSLGLLAGKCCLLELDIASHNSDSFSFYLQKVWRCPGCLITDISEHRAILFQSYSLLDLCWEGSQLTTYI